MSATHAQLRELFLKALELPVGQRRAYLESQGADGETVRQAEELLKHAAPETVLSVRATPVATTRFHSTLQRLQPVFRVLAPLASTRGRQWVTGLVLLALLAGGGQWLRRRVRTVTEENALSALRAIEESNAHALENQLAEWRQDVEGVVALPLGKQAALDAVREPTGANLARLHQYAGGLLAAGRFSSYYLVDEKGLLRSLNDRPAKPSPATPYGMQLFTQALNTGKTVVAIPGLRRTMAAWPAGSLGVPAFTFFLPLLDGAERAGVLAVTRSIEGHSSTLEKARAFETGETYLFSPEGVILSPSRFQKQMEAWGVAERKGDGLPTIYLRDPGRALSAAPPAAGEQAATWPQTLVLRTALAGRESGDARRMSGTLAQPYRDYRGELVVGCWRWFPELDAGLVTEVDADEVGVVARLVDNAILSLLGFVGLGGAWAVISSGWLLRLRKEVDRRSQMGAYTLMEKIGEGGMGEVYLARHSLLKRSAAVKLLRRDRLDEEWFAMFENEVRTASRLRHPNTVGIYDFGRAQDGTAYCAMEYLPGLDLADWVKRTGSMPVARSIHVVRQLCSALSEAHQEGLVHCDVKPSNVMLCAMGGLHDHVKLLDFGLAQPWREGAANNTSGTPYYTAPERLQGGGEVDARCDIYSLGVLWFYLLTARLPHAEGVHWVEATLTRDAAPVTQYVDVDPDVAALVAQCLARDVKARPESVTALMAELDRLSQRHPWTAEQAQQAWKR